MARQEIGQVTRPILKLSGELFEGVNEPIDFNKYNSVAKQLIKIVNETHIQLAIVVGGGNIFRGRQREEYVDHSEADSMGMMATVMNGIGLREALVRNGAIDTRLMTPFHLQEFAEPYIRLKGQHHLENHRIVILAGGLGRPNFSTDSAVAQYADELKCQLVLKASTVDGVYNTDPKKDANAIKYQELTFRQALLNELKVMDQTAFAMCMNTEIPIFVFNIADLDKLPVILRGNFSFGTLIVPEK